MNETEKKDLQRRIGHIKVNITTVMNVDVSSLQKAKDSIASHEDYLSACLRDWEMVETKLEEGSGDIEMDFQEFSNMMKETADNLKKLRFAARQMRWQFGGTDNENYAQLENEVNKSVNGWMSSQC